MNHSPKRRIRAIGIGFAALSVGASGLLVTATAQASPRPAIVHPHPAIPPLDHFLCYSVAKTAGFKAPPGITLVTALQPAGFPVSIGGAIGHCNPANKIVPGAKFPAKNPLAHLLCFRLASQMNPRKVAMHNQFGKGVMQSSTSPNALCLPSWKDPIGPPNMTPNQPPGLDHFTCYPMKPITGAYGFKPGAVKAEDQFSAPNYVGLKLGVATTLCVPTIKILPTGQAYKPMTPLDQSLLCFPTSPTPYWKVFFDQNQFGQGPVALLKPTNLNEKFCVPTTIDSIT